jgi:hypothetical protein
MGWGAPVCQNRAEVGAYRQAGLPRGFRFLFPRVFVPAFATSERLMQAD